MNASHEAKLVYRTLQRFGRSKALPSGVAILPHTKCTPSEAGRAAAGARLDSKLDLKLIPTHQLAAFADDAARNAGPDDAIPISPTRARAQARNPDADPNDVALAAAYLDGACVACLGILIGKLRIGERLEKVRWATAWWASAEHKGRGFGRALLSAALGQPSDFLSAGNSEAAERSFRRFGCRTLPSLEWDNILVQPPLGERVLAGVRRRLGLRTTNSGAEPPTLLHMRRPGGGRLALRRVEKLSANAGPFQWQRAPEIGFHRGPETINWTVSHPWISGQPEATAGRYYFARTQNAPSYALYEAYDEAGGDYAGFVLFQILGGTAGATTHLLDYCFDRDADASAGAAALALTRHTRALALRVPSYVSQHLGQVLPSGSRSRRRTRTCFWWPAPQNSPLAEVADQLALRHVDGDIPFI